MGCVSGERFGDGPAVLAMLTRVSCRVLEGVARSQASLGAKGEVCRWLGGFAR